MNSYVQIQHPELAAQIDEFICKLQELKSVNEPFLFVSLAAVL